MDAAQLNSSINNKKTVIPVNNKNTQSNKSLK
jgi:hypothetical protein